MKKLLFVLLVLCLSLTACAKQEPSVGGPGSTWNHTEYSTIEELNTAAKTNIAQVDLEKTEEHFDLISDSIAQYLFKVGDEDWCIRASEDVDNDISGLHYDSIGFEKDTTATYYTDEVYAFRFFYENVQYVVSLDVKDKDISMSYFDSVCNEFKTNVTGVKSGYENEVIEEGNDIIYRAVVYEDDGSAMIMDTIYTFEDDKMVKITSNITFETEEAREDYLNLLLEYGRSLDEFTIDGTTISTDGSANIDFYSDYTKQAFKEMMESSIAQ